jgi:hypothetical protein
MEMIDYIWEHNDILEDVKARNFLLVFVEEAVSATPIMKDITDFIDLSDSKVAPFLHEGELVSTVLSRIDETLQLRKSSEDLHKFVISFNDLVLQYKTDDDMDFTKFSGLKQFANASNGKYL